MEREARIDAVLYRRRRGLFFGLAMVTAAQALPAETKESLLMPESRLPPKKTAASSGKNRLLRRRRRTDGGTGARFRQRGAI